MCTNYHCLFLDSLIFTKTLNFSHHSDSHTCQFPRATMIVSSAATQTYIIMFLEIMTSVCLAFIPLPSITVFLTTSLWLPRLRLLPVTLFSPFTRSVTIFGRSEGSVEEVATFCTFVWFRVANFPSLGD